MKNKYQPARIKVIDSALASLKPVKTSDLVKRIKDILEIEITQRQVEKDLEFMQEDPPMGFSAPIKKDTKRKAYYYTEPFTIRAFGLREEHFNALLFYSKTLHQFSDYKIFQNISEAIEKVLDNYKVTPELKELFKSKTILQTEKVIPIKGHEHISSITQALEENKKISFTYKPFGKKASKRILAPCLLREDKHMWYVLGKVEGENFTKTYALDRMNSLEIMEEKFEPIEFNPDEYFKYSFGITVSPQKPIKVILSFTPLQGNYLKALPIHETQKIIVDNNDEFKISLNVKPSYEFYSKILSYGKDVKIVSPKSVIKEIKSNLMSAIEKYK